MAARFRLRGKGVIGYQLEGIDGRALGRVTALEEPDAEIVVRVPGDGAALDKLKPLAWSDVVWIDPVRRTLLVTRRAAVALSAAVRSEKEHVAAHSSPVGPRFTSWRLAPAIATLGLVVFSIGASLLMAEVTSSDSPRSSLLGLATGAIATGTITLVWRRPHRTSSLSSPRVTSVRP
jgi:hypothetical protein